MKSPRFILLVAFIIFSYPVVAQGKEDKTRALYEIGRIYHPIDNYKNYDSIEIDDAEDFLGHGTDNGGTLKGYYRNDTLKKIVEWVGLSNRVIENHYYFDSGKLIYVRAIETRYDFNDSAQTIDQAKLKLAFRGAYYFRNGKFLDAITYDKEKILAVKEDAASFIESGMDYKKLLDARKKMK